ncbi:MAG: hypothetical protein N2314_01770 [Brevinematales bacterium]|nr:hypothetical protein [Brevinematales bacterium]
MRKKPNLNFDELKNPMYTYHYSREERLRRRRSHSEETPQKWYYRLVGNNKTTLQLLVFYILLAVVFWFFWWGVRSQAEDKRVFRVGEQRFVEVRWIEGKQKKGWNVLLDNKSSIPWRLAFVQAEIGDRVVFSTNVSLEIEPNDYLVWFFPWEEEKPALTKMVVNVKE